MKIKLTKFAQKALSKKPLITCQTAFLTKAGPAAGTIWWDRDAPSSPPTIVKSISFDNKVLYENEGWDHLTDFLANAVNGRYVLIGVRDNSPPAIIPRLT